VALLEEQELSEKYRPRLTASVTTIQEGSANDIYIGSMVAGTDGVWAAGRRRLGWAWYDNRRNRLLRRLGCVDGDVVQHSLRAAEVPVQVLAQLEQEAAQWPAPWQEVTRHSLRTRSFVGLPVAEYVPDTLVAGRLALVGDAAHVLTPITASGFNASLQDAAALADCLTQIRPGASTAQALRAYETQRLAPVRQLVQSGQSFSRSFSR
jgi:2-polyprenyl-6-methoxyphenol hydroxylase-like FAD-dependent oxidoreductase